MMEPLDAPILWCARAYAGESECPAESLALLSMIEGQASVPKAAASESSEAHRCLSAMLASLAFAARPYYPLLEPRVQPRSSMTIFIDWVTKNSAGPAKSAAWMSVTYENCLVSATVWDADAAICEIGAIECRDTDGIWDIALRLLRAMFPQFSHRQAVMGGDCPTLEISRQPAIYRRNGH